MGANYLETATHSGALGEERKLFFFLLGLQVGMVLLLAFIVLSPGYSIHFNKMMRDYYLHEHRAQKGNPGALTVANRYSASSDRRFPDLELTEELARYGGSKKIAAISEKKLLTLSKSDSAAVNNIARPKAISLELLLAKRAIKQGNVQSAKKSLSLALALIRVRPTKDVYSRTGYIRSYLQLSTELADLQKDQRARDTFAQELHSLDDAEGAQKFYEQNDIDGFELDFPTSLRVQSLLARAEGNSKLDANSLDKILALCAEPSVPKSTRIPVLAHALAIAQSTNDNVLSQKVLKAWYPNSQETPTSKEEAFLILGLVKPAAILQNAEIGDSLFRSLMISHQRNLLGDDTFSGFVADIASFAPGLDLVVPSAKASSEKLVQIDKLLEWAASNHADSLGLLTVKAGLLMRAGNAGAAQQIDENLLGRNGILEKNREYLLANNLRAEAAALPPDKRVVFLERVLGSQPWTVQQQREFLFVLATSYETLKEDAKWRSTLQKLYSGLSTTRLPVEFDSQRFLDEYQVRSLFLQGKLDEAKNCFRKLKILYSSNQPAWEKFCRSHFAWLRAYPTYDEKRLSDAEKGLYPEECFRESLKVSRDVHGAESQIYSECLLYFAEYEFCRGNYSESKKLCKEITSTWTAKNSLAYLAAADLYDELAGNEIKLKESYPAIAGSKAQVDSLHSIYFGVGRNNAKLRMEKLLLLIREE